jgi:hypothetical protein
MDKYFDYEDVEEDKKLRHVVTRLKGHATLWWDELQAPKPSLTYAISKISPSLSFSLFLFT